MEPKPHELAYKVLVRLAVHKARERPSTERLMTIDEFAALFYSDMELQDDWAGKDDVLWKQKKTSQFESGDVLVDYRGSVVILQGFVESVDKLEFLKKYWSDKYQIIIADRVPPIIAQVIYPATSKVYDYPPELLKIRTPEWAATAQERNDVLRGKKGKNK